MRNLMLFLMACAWAALAPLLSGSGEQGSTADVVWPTHWEGRPLRPLALTSIETRVAGTFPGAMARFTDGSQEILFRRVERPTRKLHPASDCLTASGYQVKPLPAETAGPGRIWSRLSAERKGERLEVREIVLSGDVASPLREWETAETWTDVSSWYWSAFWDDFGSDLGGRSAGPWTAVTLSRRI